MAEQGIAFPIEKVPDTDSVFMRAHKQFIPDGTLAAGVFRVHDGGMSVDWSKYSTPEQTRARAKRDPQNNAVLEMNVGEIRSISTLDVTHRPKMDNQAHCDVPLPSGEDLTEVRFKLRRIAKVILALPPSMHP
ncbi:MAG: hypothetical protein WAM66_09550 [Acidobacteriaceae bacterium]